MHTTRSWKFVGLDGPLDPFFDEKSNETNRDILAKAKHGEDIIVGMVDSGKLCAYISCFLIMSVFLLCLYIIKCKMFSLIWLYF